MGTDEPFEQRPIGAEQFDAWLALLAAVEAEDHEDDHLGPDDLAEYLADPYCDFARGSVAFYDGPTMVGYGYLKARTEADPVHQMYYLGAVHPAYRGRGVGAALLAWAERAAPPLHRERYPDRPLTLYSSSLARNARASELYAAHGYTPARWFHGMTRDLTAPLPDIPAPPGIELRGFTAERSEDARMVRNEAFRDHWGSTESSEQGWAHMTSGPAFRPGLGFVAYDVEDGAADGGTPLGMVLAEEYAAHTEATGERDMYISLVGTRRAGRKRGIASALLVRALAEAREAGFATASLGVDADSPTGALGLYEHVGFTVKDSWIAQLKPLRPAAA